MTDIWIFSLDKDLLLFLYSTLAIHHSSYRPIGTTLPITDKCSCHTNLRIHTIAAKLYISASIVNALMSIVSCRLYDKKDGV